MALLSMPVRQYAARPVLGISPEDSLERAQELLTAHQISALAVNDASGRLVGVVTRTDLLRVGRAQAGARRGALLLALPAKTVAEVMTEAPTSVAPEASVADAAKLLTDERVHRVFLVEDGRATGVFSTHDVLVALADARNKDPILEHSSRSVFSVEYDDPISLATERLERARVTGLVVVENDWPIGIFSQIEALKCRDLPRETPVEDVLDPAMLCLNVATPLSRAAQQAAAMNARRVLAVENRQLRGVLSGLDFARVAAS